VAVDQLTVTARRSGVVTVLAVAGELDLASGPVLDRALEEASGAGDQLIVLDLAELGFADVAGVHAMTGWDGRLRDQGKRLALINLAAPVARLLSLTGAREVLDIAESVEDAASGI
jgi:anti-sigma B factor antagonist